MVQKLDQLKMFSIHELKTLNSGELIIKCVGVDQNTLSQSTVLFLRRQMKRTISILILISRNEHKKVFFPMWKGLKIIYCTKREDMQEYVCVCVLQGRIGGGGADILSSSRWFPEQRRTYVSLCGFCVHG